jgi:CobQ-like glutamine amidotransferase family enzyme
MKNSVASSQSLRIMCLYPNEMNIYGDHGNLLTLVKRAEWRGIKTEYIQHEVGQEFDDTADMIIGGGGQDSGQDKIQADLLKNASAIKALAERGVPMLMICGLYQLFGHYFETNAGHHINGIGLFDAWTKAGPVRLVGNVTTETDLGEIVGYENHSGLTHLNKGQVPFGKIIRGDGNNGSDRSEGARRYNVIGSYLHGPILPKNPRLADELLKLALTNKYGSAKLKELDDNLAAKAHGQTAARPH